MKKIFESALGRVLADKRRKRITAAIVVPLFCTVALLTALLLAQPALTAAGDRWDLNNFVVNAVIKDSEGNEIPVDGTGTVARGDAYSVALSFDGYKAGDLSFLLRYKPDAPNQGTLVYRLPDGVTMPDVFVQGNPHIIYMGPVNAALGEYSVTADGLVIVRFYNVDLYGEPDPYGDNLLVNYPNLKFELNLEVEFTGEGGTQQTFDFGDGEIELTVTSPPPVLDVVKTASDFDPETESISYSITITALNGDVKDIVVDDLAQVDSNTETWWIDKSGGSGLYMDIIVTSTDSDWPPYTITQAPWNTDTGTGLKFDFTGRTLHEGESITIAYIICISPFLDAYWSEEGNAGWPERGKYGYDFNVNNGVLVSGSDEDGNPVDSVLIQKTRPIHVYPPGQPVYKGLEGSTGSRASFSLVVNPAGLRLNLGTPYDGRITLTDRMNNTLAFYLNTIKVWELKPGMTVDDPDCWKAYGDDNWSWEMTGETDEYTEVTFDLPDQKPLKITYDARVKGDVGEDVEIGNFVEITGGYKTGYSGPFHIENTGGGAIDGTVTLYKRDSMTNAALPGAAFALYLKEAYTDWDDPVNQSPNGVPQTIKVGDEDFYYIRRTYGLTDGYGRITFSHTFLQYENYVFALYEIKAPEGYSLPAERATLFSFGSQTADVGGVPVEMIGDSLFLGNTPSKVVIEGRKRVEGIIEGIRVPEETFLFTLTQVEDAKGTPMKDPIIREKTVGTVGEREGGYSFAFDPIYGLPVGIYYFKVAEETGGVGNWDDDGTAYIAEVVVFDGDPPNGQLDCTVTYYTADGEPPVFVNEYNPSASLMIGKVVEDQYDGTVFTYTVKCGGSAVDLTGIIKQTGGSGIFDATDLENGIFSMTRDTTVTIYDLTPGIYTVTEDAKGYAITYKVYGREESATEWNSAETAGVDVIEDGTVEIVFTNVKYSPILPETGGIGIDKFFVVAAALTGFMFMLGTGTLIYRRQKRRRCLCRRE